MRFLALALDFDGTIAQNDQLDCSVRQAIANLRAKGIVVLLVTGRRLDDLERVTGGLQFADAVVTENGAVLAAPQSGYVRKLGPPPPGLLLERMRANGIAFAAGSCLVEADASRAAEILQIIQGSELPLTLAFNRSRVMVLPQGISKASGLEACLAMLRLSAHNTVAIGDAENDHAMLAGAELGLAVEWGSEALKGQADAVLPGSGPPDVAKYLAGFAPNGNIPVPAVTRRRLCLGYLDNGSEFCLQIRGRNVLAAGDPKSGKSWVVGLLCEQLILLGYSLCILDPEGDYTSLEALPGATVFGGSDPLPKPRDFVKALRHADASVIVDLSQVSHDEKLTFVRSLLPALATLRRSTGLPHRIVLDEAHYFLKDPEKLVLEDLRQGGYTMATYRASELNPAVLEAASAIIVTRESDPREVERLRALFSAPAGEPGTAETWRTLFDGLRLGEAAVLPLTAEAAGTLCHVRLAPHTRHCAKYIDVPLSERSAFVFAATESSRETHVRTLRDFVQFIEKRTNAELQPYLKRQDFSKWIAQSFGDYPLAQTVRSIEVCQASRDDAGMQIGFAIRTRYQFQDEE